MNIKTSDSGHPSRRSADSKQPEPKLPPESEAAKKGGVAPAKRQAEHDWDDSAKESGD